MINFCPIDAISKLAPLMPDYINYTTKDIATAAMVVTVKHSIRWLPDKYQENKGRIEKLRMLYSRWIQTLFSQYSISKDLAKSLIKKIKIFLDRVCE